MRCGTDTTIVVPYTNRARRTVDFVIDVSHPELLAPIYSDKAQHLTLGAQVTGAINLEVFAQRYPGTVEAYIFVTDKEKPSSECIKLSLVYAADR